MSVKLYHKDVFMPQKYIEQALYQQKNIEEFIFTKHFIDTLENKQNDIHHKVDIKEVANAMAFMKKHQIRPFEIEVTDEKVTKYVVKYFSKIHDIVLVMRNNVIITVYSNPKNDNHVTLNRKKYCVE